MTSKVTQHSVIIQFLDRCSDPGTAKSWESFWTLRDFRDQLRIRRMGEMNPHGPLSFRMRAANQKRHIEAMDFFQRGPGEDPMTDGLDEIE